MINLKFIGSDPKLYPNKDGGGFAHGFVGNPEKLKEIKLPTAEDYKRAGEDYAKEIKEK